MSLCIWTSEHRYFSLPEIILEKAVSLILLFQYSFSKDKEIDIHKSRMTDQRFSVSHEGVESDETWLHIYLHKHTLLLWLTVMLPHRVYHTCTTSREVALSWLQIEFCSMGEDGTYNNGGILYFTFIYKCNLPFTGYLFCHFCFTLACLENNYENSFSSSL